MRIEHIAMYVENLEDAKNFFIKYFNAVPSEKYHIKKQISVRFLSFEDDTRLEIMNKPSLNDTTDKLSGTGYVHIAFSVGSRTAVDELTEKMKLTAMRC